MNARCEQCQGKTTLKRGVYHYTESGLDNVYLQNVEMRVCEVCGFVTPRIYRMNELHTTIGRAIALKNSPLTGAEARYLRKHLGLKSKEWAAFLRLDVSTISRIENGAQPIGPQADALIRAIYFLALADKQGIKIPERVIEKIADFVANVDEESAVVIDPTKKPPYTYRLKSEIAACV